MFFSNYSDPSNFHHVDSLRYTVHTILQLIRLSCHIRFYSRLTFYRQTRSLIFLFSTYASARSHTNSYIRIHSVPVIKGYSQFTLIIQSWNQAHNFDERGTQWDVRKGKLPLKPHPQSIFFFSIIVQSLSNILAVNAVIPITRQSDSRYSTVSVSSNMQVWWALCKVRLF